MEIIFGHTQYNKGGGGILFGSRHGTMFQNLANSDIPTRLWLEVFRVYNQDYKYVKSGLLKFQRDSLLMIRRRRLEKMQQMMMCQ